MLRAGRETHLLQRVPGFNGHPPLGVNATGALACGASVSDSCFNGHPPLGVNATSMHALRVVLRSGFQWAPTLGGECYSTERSGSMRSRSKSFNGHPPLGVNATTVHNDHARFGILFQWAPTLGGECYKWVSGRSGWSIWSFNGHPPLGVNATPDGG